MLLNRPGRTPANPYGYSDAGFNITLADSATNDLHNYRTVTTPPAGSALAGSWKPDARYVHPTLVTDTSTRSAFLSVFNGLNANGTWTLFLADIDPGGTNSLNSWALEITGNPKIKPIVTWTNPVAIAYPAALSATQLNAAADVPGVFTYSPSAATILSAGSNQTLSVTFVPRDTTNYAIITTNVSLTVLKAPLTITANATNRIYGGANPTFTASYSGFISGEGPTNLITPVTFSTPATTSSPANTYAITPGDATAQNYAISFVNGTLTVVPAALSVVAQDATRTYGETNPIFTGALAGLLNNDDITASYTTAATMNSPVGIYDITPVLNDPGGKLSNYTLFSTNGVMAITAGTIIVTANDKAKVYGEALPGLTASYAGFVLGEDTNSLTTLAALTTTAVATSDVGFYPITASGAASSNYTFNYITGILTIAQSITAGTLTSSTNPAPPGVNVIFTMTVNAFAPGAGTPSGTVDFRVDDTIAGSVVLSGGVATFSLDTLPTGIHSVVAEYTGNSNFLGTTNSLTPAQLTTAAVYAASDTLERYPSQGVKVRIAALLANDFTVDTNGFAFESAAATSSEGGTISMNEGWLFYEPPSGFTNADTFTYVITNSVGQSAVGTVTVVTHPNVDPSQSAGPVQLLGGGDRLVEFLGIPDRTYTIEFTEQLDPADWQPLGTSRADVTGWFEFIDTPPTNAPVRSYRSTHP